MKNRLLQYLFVWTLLSTLTPELSTVLAQGSAFTYQGRLNDGATPATGIYDLLFAIYDATSGGGQLGPAITNAATPISNGLFTVSLDFGSGVFTGADRWLEIGVRTNGSPADFLLLNPRQPFTPAPYALYAANAGAATTANTATAVAANSVANAGLQANAVTTDKIADGTIAVADLSPVLASNTFWRLGGNSGTSAGTHFVGTTDDQALEIKVNGARALRLEPKYWPNVIGGGESNAVSSGAAGATIAGGGDWWEPNTISGDYGAIGGGRNNRATSFETAIAGGRGNLASGGSSAIGGGYVNTASGDYATVPGGMGNVASNSYASALGNGCTAGGVGALAAGAGNLASGDAAVALGSASKATGPNSVALGRSSEARGVNSTAIGEAATASGRASIAMGSATTASGDYSLVGGGVNNYIHSNALTSTISGGSSNAVYGYASSIAGGELNIIQVAADHSTIGGGGFNSIAGSARYPLYSTVSGGYANRVETNSSYVLIGGGYGNTIQADAPYSTIGGGAQNTIHSNARTCVIAGGADNTVESNVWRSTISGGRYNTIKAPAYHATISGGTYNTNAGTFGVVPGGDQNYAGGTNSLAAGHRAKANYQGDFVWADSQDVDFNSTANDQFLIRATGGVGIGVTNPTTALEVAGNVKATAFQGDGSGLTGVGATTLGGQTASAFWQLGGNSGTLPGAQFLGTADNQSLELKVNGARALRLEPNASSPNVIGGHGGNIVSNGVYGAVIAGGGNSYGPNRAGGHFSAVLGGFNNSAAGYASAAMGSGTLALADYSTAMGAGTVAKAQYATAMGRNTTASGFMSTATGEGTTASGYASTALGAGTKASGAASLALGEGTVAAGAYSLAAGWHAETTNRGTFVWADSSGAFSSTADNQFLIRASGGVGIGTANPTAALEVAGSVKATAFQGDGSGLTGVGATTLGGQTASAFWQLGGNSGSTPGANFLGTADNQALELKVNSARALRLEPHAVSPNVIGGYAGNIVSNGFSGAFIGGGGDSTYPHQVGGDYAAVLGGRGNTATGYGSTAMGAGAFAEGHYSTAMGLNNNANGWASTAMGANGVAIGASSTTMGYSTTATGSASTAMGESTVATGDHSLAVGYYAQANHHGSFVWADYSSSNPFSSSAANQFCVRATGGVRLDNSTSMYLGSRTRQMLNLYGTAFGIGVQSGSLYSRCDNLWPNSGFIWYKGGVHNDDYANAGGGVELMHLTESGLWVRGTFVSASDRNAKENFSPVDSMAVLDKVAALPLSEWNYKQDPATRHLGPMAQDFHAAFGVGPDDKHIATVDADGVALAAIQGLNEKLEFRSAHSESRFRQLEAENAELKQRLGKIEQLLNQRNGSAK